MIYHKIIERDIDINIEWKINKILNSSFEEYSTCNNRLILNRTIFTEYTHPDNCQLFLKILICKNCSYILKIIFKHKRITFKDIIYEINNNVTNINQCFCNNLLKLDLNDYIKFNYIRSHHGIYIK